MSDMDLICRSHKPFQMKFVKETCFSSFCNFPILGNRFFLLATFLNQGCNSAIIACGRGGQWEIAISLLWTMLSRLCAVDIYTGYSTVWACETAGKWELALKVLKLIPETRVRMPTRFYLFEFKDASTDFTL